MIGSKSTAEITKTKEKRSEQAKEKKAEQMEKTKARQTG